MRKYTVQGCLLWVLLGLIPINTTAQMSGMFGDKVSVSWADSVLSTLTMEEKIGQLFMVEAYSNSDSAHVNKILTLIHDHHIGGLIFMQGGPERHAHLNNMFQSQSDIPLLISIDGEWGLSMRLDSTIRYPRQMTLGAGGDTANIYKMGRQIGRECKAMGIHVNFAPVADINNNPLNPVINSRSFGERKEDVARMSLMYMQGLQDEGVMACGKHFPGHGNTSTDSHLELPVVNRDAVSLSETELYPFTTLINNGLASMMVAHMSLPLIIKEPKLPASLAPEIIDSLLYKKLGFNGLVFTDALNMKGVANSYPTGTLEIKALIAGNDVLLFSMDVKAAIDSIKHAVDEGRLDSTVITSSVRKILIAKHYIISRNGVFADGKQVKQGKFFDDGNYLSASLFSDAITLLKNNKETIPLKKYGGKKIASLVINDTINNPFQKMLFNYAPVDVYRSDKNPTAGKIDTLASFLKEYDYVILSIHNTSTRASSGYGISEKINDLILNLAGKVKLITVLFGNSYAISRLPDADMSDAFLISYEDTYWPQYFTAQALFGAVPVGGKLPVSPALKYRVGDGMTSSKIKGMLSHELPEAVGIATAKFSGIDSIVNHALSVKAMPGCRVLMAHKGKIIFNKSYGYHTYDSIIPVRETDIYDIASMTKIMATALAVMKLVDERKLDINKKLYKYLPEFKKTNKKNLVIADILTHNSGLKAWLPLYKNLLREGLPDTTLLKDFPTKGYSTSLTQCLYLKDDYEDEIWNAIKESKVEKKGTYVYSDLGMIIMKKVVEHITGQSLFDYVQQNFYQPLGLNRIGKSPVTAFPLDEVVPTEYDSVLRCELIKGYVHDPLASMMGGMGGHAGIFSDAQSVAVIMQMLLNGGSYGGVRYISSPTVKKFTSKYFEGSFNRRGLIFDKPELIRTPDGPTAVSASPKSFGHSGFTGTCTWADPETQIVYVFLSNRVYPSAANNKLGKMNVRTEVMDYFYRLIDNK
jgi:beta-N-acetylhexosaminidase